MRILIGNLFGATASTEAKGWSVSAVVHALAAMLGVLYGGHVPIEHSQLPGSGTSMELVADWVQPEDPAPPAAVVKIVPDTTPVDDETICNCTKAIVPRERENSPINACMCQPPTELAMTRDQRPMPSRAATRREAVGSREEPVSAPAVAPSVIRRTRVANLPTFQARRSISDPTMPVVPSRRQSTSGTAGAAVDELPRKLETNPAPPYPPDAYARRQQGRVLLEVRVDEHGLVGGISVSESSGVSSLDRAALETVRKWRFEPARRGGTPVASVVIVPIRFVVLGLPASQ